MTVLTRAYASPPRSRGARPIALGNGYTAVSGDAYALFYNPAGLRDINQQEITLDYGRSHSAGETARSDFNGLYAMPWRWKDRPIPIAFGIYGERPVPGSHIVDITAGGGLDVPADRWTKGFIKVPVRGGLALTLRSQNGEKLSNRVGASKLTAGLTGGLMAPLGRNHQLGFAVRHLSPASGDPRGPSLHLGFFRHHREFLDMYAELEYGRGGVWRFHPGFEWLLARGVLRPRLGWGFRDNGGVDSLATGVGLYISPLQIDVAHLIPLKTLNDNMSQFRVSLSYRFGRPQFSEIYYDRALEAASQLDQRVLSLTVKEAELKASLAEVEQRNRLAREELENVKARIQALRDQDLLGDRDAKIRDLKARVHSLESQLSDQRQQTNQLRRQKATVRTHTVAAGDTLQKLAKEYYGDANQWKKIYNANTDKIDRGLPKVGAKLVIP